MSAHQGIPACLITVDGQVADVWRVEAKKVLMHNHEPFEDYLDYVPARQLALADIFRDATAVIDVLGWDPDTTDKARAFEVPLTPGHVQQLYQRRCDLLDTDLDLLDDIGADNDANVMAGIHANRRSTEAINHVLNAYSAAIIR